MTEMTVWRHFLTKFVLESTLPYRTQLISLSLSNFHFLSNVHLTSDVVLLANISRNVWSHHVLPVYFSLLQVYKQLSDSTCALSQSLNSHMLKDIFIQSRKIFKLTIYTVCCGLLRTSLCFILSLKAPLPYKQKLI